MYYLERKLSSKDSKMQNLALQSCDHDVLHCKHQTVKQVREKTKMKSTCWRRFIVQAVYNILIVMLFSPSSHCFSVRGFAYAAEDAVSALSLDPTKAYQYSYEAVVELNEAYLPENSQTSENADVGVRINAVIELKVLWTDPSNRYDQIIEMQLEGADVFNVSDSEKTDLNFDVTRNSIALRTITKPVIFRWCNGMIVDFYANAEETVTSLNIKRGILGFFQIQTKDGDREEEDLSGRCNVSYKVDGMEVKKEKDMESCVNGEESFTTMNQVLGVTTQTTNQGLYNLSPDRSHILYAVNMESHLLHVNARQEISLYSSGRQKLGLLSVDTVEETASQSKDEALQMFAKERKKLGEKYVKQSLKSERDIKNCAEECLEIGQVISNSYDLLSRTNMANVSSAQAYILAVRAARQADKRTLLQVLRDNRFKDIRFTLVDILAAAQTDDSQDALMEALDFKAPEQESLVERAITGIAFSSHPSEKILSDLLKLFKSEIKSPKVEESVGLALGAVLQKFCAVSAGNCEKEVARKALQVIHQGFMESTTERTQNLYILIARNTRMPDFIGRLMYLAEHSKFYLVCHHAITALSVYETKDFDETFRKTMSRIYHQNHKTYDHTIRAAAGSRLLMNSPSELDIMNIILSLPEEKSREFANFMYQRMLDLIKTNHPSKEVLLKVLSDHKISNYWTMANSGLASAFTGYLFASDDSQVTYGLFMEYTNAGMMRRTLSDFTLHGQGHSLALTEAGIVVQGLESLTGSEPDKGEEEYDSMVGMSSIMMGVKLRPLTFFRGYGDMMSLIWAGSDGEPSGVEAMLMLVDHLQHIPMSSGLRLKAEVLGAISTKISAVIDFSLWSRTVEIVTTNGGALSIQCRLVLESPILRASVRNSAEAQSSIDLSVFTDFSSLPPKSCLRISYPEFKFTKSMRKFEKVRGSVKSLKSLRKRTHKNYGKTLPLQQGNSVMCSKIIVS